MGKYISNRNHTLQWLKDCRSYHKNNDYHLLANDLQYTIKVHPQNNVNQHRICKNAPCSPDLKFGILVCSYCNWSEKI
jgi:hypothetical protein